MDRSFIHKDSILILYPRELIQCVKHRKKYVIIKVLVFKILFAFFQSGAMGYIKGMFWKQVFGTCSFFLGLFTADLRVGYMSFK